MANYELNAKEGRNVVIVVSVLGAVAVLSVVLRIVSRKKKHLRLALDDYLMVLALCFVLASTVLVITSVTQGGVGFHASDIALTDVEYTLKIIIPWQALYGVGLALVKSSVMLLYYRLFGTKKSLRIAIYATTAIVWGWALSIVLESLLLCMPFAYNWSRAVSGGHCANRNVAFVVAGVLNIVTDFIIMLLPLPYVWTLQLPVGRKLGLALAFCLGLIVSAISIIRVVSLAHINFMDPTHSLPLPFMWTIVEEQLTIVCANLPLVRHLFAAILPARWFDSPRRPAVESSGRMQFPNGSNEAPSMSWMSHGVVTAEFLFRGMLFERKSAPSWWSTEDSQDGHSDVELAARGAPPGGIKVLTTLEWRREV
ncbi:hypothetical protein BO70DRAFT_163137 [Aspergillus heteromorphus CBS 117.55]|uniref:Rhodopsin domain-containing protein n=1 Tax=Aspergillus heteromorphus CBS 117.55 TaxID=1448321 RepID=A0A317WVG6_9EURO|nr:uncharacterized protein BO70DRAFT_163137 [Aspergillus heteromorphus CBS 117.55]PWY89217.1 hypothetical protein BO70DRAFT_163137 [Aspergillus heteromorphus CBS 117.55]